MLIPCNKALEIIREVCGGNPNRTMLKAWADQGRIDRVAIHAKCALYHDDQVRAAAMARGKQHSSLGKFAGLEVVG